MAQRSMTLFVSCCASWWDDLVDGAKNQQPQHVSILVIIAISRSFGVAEKAWNDEVTDAPL